MPLVLANRVQETSTTTGTGTLTLDGAVLGYQTFAAGIGSGNTCYYAITSGTGAWEVGIGTVGTGTLARTTLLSSSTGSLVSFTGTLNVFVTYPSEKSVNLDASNNLTVLNTTRLGGLSGNQSLQVNNVASAVNYTQITGAVTGGAPVVSAQGSDTDIGLTILGKGSGAINVGGTSGASPSLSVATVLSQVNSFQVYGNSAGNSPTLAAIGSDTNIAISIKSKGTSGVTLQSNNQSVFALSNVNGSDFTNYYTTTGNLNYTAAGGSTNINFAFASKGTGAFNFATGNGRQAQISDTASAVNYLGLTGAATGAAPTISAQGSDANIGLVLNGKGTGSIQLQSSGAAVLNISSSGTGVGDFINIYPTSGFINWVLAGTDTNIGYVLTTKGGLGFYFSTGGGQQAAISHTASAVNYLNLTGAATGAAPTISAQGSDANINLALTAKGTGGQTFNTNGGQQFAIAHTASAVDYLQATGNGGGFPSLSAQGASANVSMVYGTKGTGNHNFTTNGTSVNQLIVAHIASAVNYVRVAGGATGASPSISAQGSDANIDLNLFTKGTGVLRFGTYTAGVLSPTGYITIMDAAGTSRRLLVG